MTFINNHITQLTRSYFDTHYQIDLIDSKIVINETKDDFEGDFTLVVFPLAGIARKKPDELAQLLGEHLVTESKYLSSFNVVKGFLNLSCTNEFWIDELDRQINDDHSIPQIGPGKIILEYASPNSNKPLHLGHVRNVLLGWSVGRLLKAVGYDVHYTQIVNDRGVAICKSMLSWQKYFDGATPKSTGIKPDHLVGNAYVRFNEELAKEYDLWKQSEEATHLFDQRKDSTKDRAQFFSAFKNEYFNSFSALGRETRDMLLAWEDDDPDTKNLWQKMKDWFMHGFLQTCARLEVGFDSMNFESDTYLLGKDIVQDGLEKKFFYKEEDGSVWIDLTDEGLDKKIILRSDGTSVYMTQDLGTARTRYKEHRMDGMIYTVGNEQNYHFETLFKILQKLGEPYSDRLHHLSYGMVDLPTGRMKTREGTVVDADDLIEEVMEKVRQNSAERGELNMLPETKKEEIIETIGMSALKYYMLRVDAKKRMVFNPSESVDLQGQTGPYIQNAYVRIRSIMRKLNQIEQVDFKTYEGINDEEKRVLKTLMTFGEEVVAAAKKYDPSIVAAYVYQLARNFHRFYHDHSIARAESDQARSFRYQLAVVVADRLEKAMELLGISMPERM